MALSTKDTCKAKTVMALAFRDGPMARGTKANGSIIRPMDKANSGMLMGTFTMVRGATTRLTVSASTPTLMALSMKASGLTIISTAKVLSSGRTAVSTMGSTVMV